jgi:hypothetical protein
MFNGRIEEPVECRWAEEQNKQELERDTAVEELRKIAGEVRSWTLAS